MASNVLFSNGETLAVLNVVMPSFLERALSWMQFVS